MSVTLVGIVGAGQMGNGIAHVFAGTGFALPIVAAIITGGVGMLLFQDQIIEWITNKGYECPKCFSSNWKSLNK